MITSLQNPLLKRFVALRNKKDRLAQKRFTIEGEKEVLHALDSGIVLESLLIAPEIMTSNGVLNSPQTAQDRLNQLSPPRPQLIELSQRAYQKIACRQNVEGVAALAHLPESNLDDLVLPDNPFLLVLHGIEKPGNLGALLRTADGAGVDAVLVVSESGTDLYNPNVIRASLGAIFTQPTLSVDCNSLRTWLNRHRITAVMTTPAAQQNYSDIDLTGPIAIVMGSEDRGLPADWLGQETCQVTIPMRGEMDSLNVSCAAAVTLYEAQRQRRLKR